MRTPHSPKATIYPAPTGETLSETYAVTADSVSVPVYTCRVSAVPLNQVWPGYQRPLEQTEVAAFACFDTTSPLTVRVTSSRKIDSVVIRPLSRKITPRVKGRHIDFEIPGACHLTVEVNGCHNALHLFISPQEQAAPKPADPNTRYFGPGVHHAGKIVLESNQTVYVAGGAVVYGFIYAKKASNIRILGRGILDTSRFERNEAGGSIRLEDCTDITIDGLVLRDPDVWCCTLFGCRTAEISNLKLVGLWRYNADGIDFCNSQDIHVRDCFVRAFDDCIVVKGLGQAYGSNPPVSHREQPVRNILVERCVLWNDWGRALEIGAETSAPEISGVIFRDCDIIRTADIAMDIQHGDRATVRNILFEDIRVENDDFNLRPVYQHKHDMTYEINPGDDYCPYLMVIIIQLNGCSSDQQMGVVRHVVFKNITVTGRHFPSSYFKGADPEHDIAGVTIHNMRVNGQNCASPEAAHLTLHPHVSDVTFVAEPHA